MDFRQMVPQLLRLNPNQIENMSTKIIIAYSIVLMTTVQNVIAQSNRSEDVGTFTSSESCLTGELFTSASTVDESTYFNSEWLSGDIYFSNGEVVRNKLIKYNGLLDELFWQEPKSKNTIKLDKEPVQQFHYLNLNGDTSIYFRKIKVKQSNVANSGEIFCEAIYNGRVSLFVCYTYFIERRVIVYMNGSPFEKAIYAEKPIYYFRSGNNKSFVTKSLNRNSLYQFSPDNKDPIKAFFKANKIRKFTSKSDLIRLTQFLNTLE